ncbi:MAG: hypothetical protein ABFR33_08780 [Verrucomicrobiota bacterium]
MKTYISILLAMVFAAMQAVHAGDGTESEMLGHLFEQGVAQYKDGNYDEAIRVFDAMLAIDKYNADAVAYRKRTAKRIASEELKKQGASRSQALADIAAAWNPAPRFYGAVPASEDALAADPGQQAAIRSMEARLKAVIIPNLDFTDTSIEDVAFILSEAGRHLGSSEEDVDFALVGMEFAPDEIPVSLSIADMNLYDAMQFVADMTSLKFEVGPNVVSIMPANFVPPSQMIMKSYDIIPGVGADLESAADSGGGMGDLFDDSSSGEASAGPADVSGFFSVVDWPEGSSAIYQPRFNKLFVRNTSKNLKAVEAILADLDEKAANNRSQQVEIEAKFVEFSEGALEELGFDWNVYGSGTAAGMELDPRGVGAVGGAPDPNTGQTILADGLAGDERPGQNLFGSAQRDNTEGFETIQSGLFGLMGGTPATMMFGNGDIDIKISAMEQEGTADVLSAPKVTTKSGAEAMIRVAETHRYPQDYDAETGQNTAPVVKAQDWEDFDMGVSLKVTPVVDSEHGTIDLELHPEILEFIGNDLYLVGYNSYSASWGSLFKQIGDGSDLKVLMPAFKRRSVETNVTVADGGTIVLGGLIDERTETFRDQVPILGDIPYLGRLFRTEGSRSAKRNLTIFVKASLVDDRGMTRAEREMSRKTAAN